MLLHVLLVFLSSLVISFKAGMYKMNVSIEEAGEEEVVV
jgi:hypothetical protein